VPEAYFVPEEQLPRWRYLKGAKREPRVDKRTGHAYFYSEGSMAFPDLPENPSRTILTGEGGSGASRFKHIVRCESGRYRRLVPDELDQLQTFPRGWTDTGMTDGRRAFCMGNALVVGVPHIIGTEIAKLSINSVKLFFSSFNRMCKRENN
jgi:DNA (cytosine-5)-methyltransferase 1